MTTDNNRQRVDRKTRRRGTVLAGVLICLFAAAAVFTVMIGDLTAARRAAQLHLRTAQAGWLAESGLERAAARLRSESNYRGETWELDLPAGVRQRGRVEISVRPDGQRQDRFLVEVVGTCGFSDIHRSQVTAEAYIVTGL